MSGRRSSVTDIAPALAAVLVLASAAAPVPAQDAAATAVVQPVEGGTRLEAIFPGRRILDVAFARVAGGTRAAVLVAPVDEAPRSDDDDPEISDAASPLPPCPGGSESERALLTFDVERPTGVARLAMLPPDVARVEALDLDGDGVDELLVASAGKLLRVDAAGAVDILLDDDDAACLAFQTDGDPDEPHIALPRWGAIELFAPTDVGRLAPVARAALPLGGQNYADAALIARSPVPRLLGRGKDGAWILAMTPEAVDDRRIRVQLVTLRLDGDSTVEDAWARLPEPEQVTETSVHLVDGAPVLVAVTRPADELSLFGDRRLRVWTLAEDRSRLGRDPSLATATAANLMQPTTAHWTDVNGDGALDLVLTYYRGLVGSDATLEVHLRGADGGFRGRRRTTAIPVKHAVQSFLSFGRDVDGDGVADLVVQSGDRIRVHPGWRSADGRNLVQDRALELPAPEFEPGYREIRISVQGDLTGVTDGNGGMRVVDVDRDGRADLVATRQADESGPARCIVLRASSPP